MADRVILTHRHQEGRVRRRGGEAAAQLRAARALRPRRGRVLDADRHARHAAPLCLELQSVLRHEGAALDRPGEEFKETKSAPAFPKDDGRALANIWSLEAGDGKKDLWCGVEPASLFRSRDGGDSWEMVPGISNHEHARKWQPGNGGLCMHTIIRDGNRVHLGISTGGHYLSEDGGETFTASNQGRRRRLRARSLSRVRPVRAQDRAARRRARPALHAEPRRMGRVDRARRAAAGHRRAAQRRPRPLVAIDRQGTAVGLRISRSSSTRTTPTRSTSCRSSRRRAPVPAARPRCGAARTAATRGAGSRAGCRRRRATSPSCATRWTSTSSSRPRSTSARRPVSSGSGREGGEKWDCLFDSLPPIHSVKVAVV